jgi:hypothetical protein
VRARAGLRRAAARDRGGQGLPRRALAVFVDNAGCLRCATALQGSKLRGEAGFLRWLQIFRDNGRPPRAAGLVRGRRTGGSGRR